MNASTIPALTRILDTVPDFDTDPLALEPLEIDASCGLVETWADGRIRRANARFADWSARTGKDLSGRRFKDLLAPASRIMYETHCVPLLEAYGVVNELMLEIVRPDGERLPVLVCAVRRLDARDAAVVNFSVFDATATRRHERELLQAQRQAEAAAAELRATNRSLSLQSEQWRVTLRSIAEAVVTTGPDGRIVSINPTALQLFGVEEAHVMGQAVQALGEMVWSANREPIDPEPQPQALWKAGLIDATLIRPDGSERQVSSTVSPIRDDTGAIMGSVFVGRDVTEERAMVRQLAHDASHDHLTGIANRREFERRLEALLRRRSASQQHSDLLVYLDLDQFKVVNDAVGHSGGDRLLRQVSSILQASLRPDDTLARLGGDEFGLILPACSLNAGLRVAERMRSALEAHRFSWQDQVFQVTASIGISVVHGQDGAAATSMADADLACNAAKARGRNRIHVFDRGDEELQAQRHEMSMVAQVRRALDEDRFALCFQPIVRLSPRPGALQHGEMLLRMRGDDGTLLTPTPFILAAERYNLIQAIDRWVVRKTLEWLVSRPGVEASINLSGQSIGDAEFLAYVAGLFAQTDLKPERVCFEITETATMGDLAAALRFMHTLKAIGVRFALDDFGVGLSSYSYLKQLPVNQIKIDGSFTRSLLTDPVNRAIVESITHISELCGLETVAEWVETEATMTALGEIGVDHAQGWHVGKPVLIDLM
jgi:diguanylate cyclase (GGDEF)-like protein/PAS domain S-box-containing protein